MAALGERASRVGFNVPLLDEVAVAAAGVVSQAPPSIPVDLIVGGAAAVRDPSLAGGVCLSQRPLVPLLQGPGRELLPGGLPEAGAGCLGPGCGEAHVEGFYEAEAGACRAVTGEQETVAFQGSPCGARALVHEALRLQGDPERRFVQQGAAVEDPAPLIGRAGPRAPGERRALDGLLPLIRPVGIFEVRSLALVEILPRPEGFGGKLCGRPCRLFRQVLSSNRARARSSLLVLKHRIGLPVSSAVWRTT